MKIHKQGRKLFIPPEDWWVGHTIYCHFCGCAFKLEAHDRITINLATIVSRPSITVACPNCNDALCFSYSPDSPPKS